MHQAPGEDGESERGLDENSVGVGELTGDNRLLHRYRKAKMGVFWADRLVFPN
ncbi:unnamed protein product [Protopolystoma xenopodis]|uniref:Uncharacterized protein n=1 Tax=Protopolystoma xenopodis TaxID=117903 RepID=A0A448XAC9_9PLAT|nr:unnamed protein product [Protopolystoma xenopodis]